MTKIAVKDVEDNIQNTVYFSGADGYNGQHFRTTIGFPNTPKGFAHLKAPTIEPTRRERDVFAAMRTTQQPAE